MAAFPDILITRTHSYEVNHKYQFACANKQCGLTFGRQKRIDLTRKVCGRCKSPFIQTKPVTKTNGKENKTNAFGMFVKERFADVKRCNPGSPHKDIMGILSKEYHKVKAEGIGHLEKRTTVEVIEIASDDDELIRVISSVGNLQV
jgi:rRNA processing protein Gar1